MVGWKIVQNNWCWSKKRK